ncbi:caspase family protein [Pseudonocardiaceae bacterium YIM PH 21723]|nr:caspase family protein [Pseudonocardiaceae bacterium YIM PH 21723]
MMQQRAALLIATDTYADEAFSRLRAPSADIKALGAVLSDPAIGNYRVRAMHNESAHAVRMAIEDLLADSHRDDQLVLYISGHGYRDDRGQLHLIMKDSRANRLGSTAVPAAYIHDQMTQSSSQRILLLLDCCYAGAFKANINHRSGAKLDVLPRFKGRGRAIITASSELELAFEEADGPLGPSIFTSALVRGLRSGEADRNRDGLIDVDELYEYVFDQVRAKVKHQTPGKTVDLEGTLYVASSPGTASSIAKLPDDIRIMVTSSRPKAREHGVDLLIEQIQHGSPAEARLAKDALLELPYDTGAAQSVLSTVNLFGLRARQRSPQVLGEGSVSGPVEPFGTVSQSSASFRLPPYPWLPDAPPDLRPVYRNGASSPAVLPPLSGLLQRAAEKVRQEGRRNISERITVAELLMREGMSGTSSRITSRRHRQSLVHGSDCPFCQNQL